jgi:hypothetical protein
MPDGLICPRLSDLPVPESGSALLICSRCGVDVVAAPSSLDYLGRVPDLIPIYCPGCALAIAKQAKAQFDGADAGKLEP